MDNLKQEIKEAFNRTQATDMFSMFKAGINFAKETLFASVQDNETALHITNVKNQTLGVEIGRLQEQVTEVESLRKIICELKVELALGYLRQAKAKFRSDTTTSVVDRFLARFPV